MSQRNSPDVGGVWNGLWYIALGVAATSVFVFYGDSISAGGIVASLALVLFGIATVLAPRLSPLFDDLNRYWTGVFWTVCGLGIVCIAFVTAGTGGKWIRGLVLGGGIVLYGLLVTIGR